ncbi:hypothetical protein [Glaciihabitans sp. UYNi722]|uniref:hypothetical protein n=1 Tax=Glaciihabitans sp. UYNi722 TaxID=3156344 RepID=UPI0033967E1A
MSYEPFDFHPSTDSGWRVHCAWLFDDEFNQHTDPIAGWLVQVWAGDERHPADFNSRRIEPAFMEDGELMTMSHIHKQGPSNAYYWILKPGEDAPRRTTPGSKWTLISAKSAKNHSESNP